MENKRSKNKAELSDVTADIVEDEDVLNIVFGGPAIVSNKFFINMSPRGMRITFAEKVAGTEAAAFRTAVMLSPEDAIGFSALISKVIEDNFEVSRTDEGDADVSATEETD
jgi:hypothetical protein